MSEKEHVLYMCGVDWQHEFTRASDFQYYDSLKEFKKARKCWKSCGIVRVRCQAKWLVKQDLMKGMRSMKSFERAQKSKK